MKRIFWGGIKLEIIEYFTTKKKEHWLNEIKKCDWGAGQYLYQLLYENNLVGTGEWQKC